MTHKVGPKGQVVIPKELRDRLGIHPGDEVGFAEEDGAVVMRRLGDVRKLGGMFAGTPSLIKEFEEERRAEREREEREIAEWIERGKSS